MEEELPFEYRLRRVYGPPRYKNPAEVRYRINADQLKHNLWATNECFRELAVSFVPMLPLLEETVRFEEADYILYEHETAQDMDMLPIVFRELTQIAAHRKPGAEIIVVGKACNAQRYLKPGAIEKITFYESHYAEKLAKRFGYDFKEEYFVFDHQGKLNIWPVNGCHLKCAFCRRTYMHIPFESIPLEEIKRQLDHFKVNLPERMRIVSLRAENLTEYGLDIYGEQRLQDVIDMLNSYPEIKQIEIHIGLAIGEITPVILDAICRCKKITKIALNIEAGSNRMLKLINKPHTREKAIHVYKTIKEAIPDVKFETMAIIGLPTETFADIEALAELIGIIQPDWMGLMYYGMAPKHPLAKLPQLSKTLRQYHQRFLLQLLKEQRKNGTRKKRIIIRYAKTRKPGTRKTIKAERRILQYMMAKGPLKQHYVVEEF